MDINLKEFEVWFVAGSQELYGEETLRQVEEQAKQIAAAINEQPQIPVQVVHKAVLTSAWGSGLPLKPMHHRFLLIYGCTLFTSSM